MREKGHPILCSPYCVIPIWSALSALVTAPPWERISRALRSAPEGVITWRFHQERAPDRLETVIGGSFLAMVWSDALLQSLNSSGEHICKLIYT
jgi:hypothetical protein